MDIKKTKASTYVKVRKESMTKFFNLSQPGNKSLCTYIWIDGTNENIRSKIQTLPYVPHLIEDLPRWSCDGAKTLISRGSNTDTYLKPVALYKDPFKHGPNKIVLCETLNFEMMPTATNKRMRCQAFMDKAKNFEPWFSIDQEYTILDEDGHPLGWPSHGYLGPEGPFYCGVGYDKVRGRDIAESHYKACLYAGINMHGLKAGLLQSQWSFDIGICHGIDIGDQVWTARYLLQRVAEDFGTCVSFDPNPKTKEWKGMSFPVCFSTKAMREKNGLAEINEAIKKLSKNHNLHSRVYGSRISMEKEDFDQNQEGENEHVPAFTSGLANRCVSIRIPRLVAQDKCGYLEDSRPPSSADPYSVTEMLVRTVCLDE